MFKKNKKYEHFFKDRFANPKIVMQAGTVWF